MATGRRHRPRPPPGCSPANPAEPRGFIGERRDPETGLLYLHARYYDPVIGRFLSPDTLDRIEPGVGTNRYAYADNDPINKSDPNGHSINALGGFAIGAAIALGAEAAFDRSKLMSMRGWGELTVAAVGGGIIGAVTATTSNPGVGASLASKIVGYSAKPLTDGIFSAGVVGVATIVGDLVAEKETKPGELVGSMAGGFVGGNVGSATGTAIGAIGGPAFATGARGLAAEISAGIVGVMSEFGTKVGIDLGFGWKPEEKDPRVTDSSVGEDNRDALQKSYGDRNKNGAGTSDSRDDADRGGAK